MNVNVPVIGQLYFHYGYIAARPTLHIFEDELSEAADPSTKYSIWFGFILYFTIDNNID